MRTVYYRIAFVFLFVVVNMQLIVAQQLRNQGLDDFLYNGRIYTYFPPHNVKGNQFLNTKEFVEGTLWIKGECYSKVLLNYDIYNQQLVLSFKTKLGAQQMIALSMAYIDSFYIDNKVFVVEHDEDENYSFYQLIEHNSISFHLKWFNTLSLKSSANGTIEYEFSESTRKVLFVYNGKLYELKRRKSLKKIFSKKASSKIIKYLKNNKLKLSKMQDDDFRNLLIYINSINVDEV
jgi:hypothetical protein